MSDTTEAIELGPLPEPAAWNAYWRGDNDGPSWDQWHDEGDPLPTTWDDKAPDEVTPYYTAEQLRAYAAAEVARAVAAERERWRGIVARVSEDANRYGREGIKAKCEPSETGGMLSWHMDRA